MGLWPYYITGSLGKMNYRIMKHCEVLLISQRRMDAYSEDNHFNQLVNSVEMKDTLQTQTEAKNAK